MGEFTLKRTRFARLRSVLFLAIVGLLLFHAASTAALANDVAQAGQPKLDARELIDRVLAYMVEGPAFDAKIRQTVYYQGREVLGGGTYEHAGEGTGRYHLQMTIVDGDGKHFLRQISDGRLAWTYQQIGESKSLSRVDAGRLDQWTTRSAQTHHLPASRLVGGMAEMLVRFSRDYDLIVNSAKLDDQRVWWVRGTLNADVAEAVRGKSGTNSIPPDYPAEISVAIATQDESTDHLGRWLPVRWEYRGPEIEQERDADDPASLGSSSEPGDGVPHPGHRAVKVRPGPLLSLMEMYSIRPIESPPADRFRFVGDPSSLETANETERYVEFFGVKLTAQDRRTLLR
ncbi:MAG: hypothetical protein AAF664_19285 [Planctomycetota bacterium]